MRAMMPASHSHEALSVDLLQPQPSFGQECQSLGSQVPVYVSYSFLRDNPIHFALVVPLKVLQVQTWRGLPTLANFTLPVELETTLIHFARLRVFGHLHDVPFYDLELSLHLGQLFEIQAKMFV